MPEFEWDEGNADHIALHGVTTAEAEDALLDTHRLGAGARNVRGERRHAMLGCTADGRLLYVVFTLRGRAIRVVTARNATPPERRRYEK